MLTDFHRFREPARASAAVSVSSGVAVEAVASGSPAEAAGLRAGDALLAIGGGSVGAAPPRLPKGKYWHDLLHERIDGDLTHSGALALRIARPGESPRTITIAGQPACRARFTLLSSGTAAMSEGHVIRVAVQLMSEHSDDSEAATMLAHELAHNILGHISRRKQREGPQLSDRAAQTNARRISLPPG